MKLVTLTEWGQATFNVPPGLATLRRWARSGIIVGARKIGRTYYVPNGAPMADPGSLAVGSQDPVVKQIIQQ